MNIKIINNVKKNGIKKTTYKIILRSYSIFEGKINLLNKKKNYIFDEKKIYWNNYSYIKRKYLKYVYSVPKRKGTNVFSNKVWWCWLQGEDNAPILQKRCLESLRKKLVDRDIVVITNENLFDYVSMPDYIMKKYKKGIISNTHFSDLIRLQLLIKYGGTWIDSTALCTKYNKELFDIPLFVYKNISNIWYSNKFKNDQEPLIADNWFITSEVENPILIMVRDLLFMYWKENDYLVDYFIMHYFFTLVVNYKYKEEFDAIPIYNHLNPHLLQYVYFNEFNKKQIKEIIKQSDFHKLTNKVELNYIRDDSFYKMFLNNNESLRKDLYE